MRSRYFNAVSYQAESNTIRKTSRYEQKLRDEIMWYLELPGELQHYIPAIREYSLQEPVFVSLEYIPSPTIAELFLNQQVPLREWEAIFSRIGGILRQFAGFPGQLSHYYLIDMYIIKTRLRIAAFLARNEWARRIHQMGYYRLNGSIALCPFRIFESHIQDFRQLLEQPHICLIHGDMCFSNILYNLHSQDIKLVDPRGRFGKRGLYGDQRYDLAKIRHSLSGYEHIRNDCFSVKIVNFEIELTIPITSLQKKLREMWDRQLGESVGIIKRIEALLFLSMLPLHRDNQARQLALYALGTQLLYEAFSD